MPQNLIYPGQLLPRVMQDACLSFMLKVSESCGKSSESWVLHKDWKPLAPGFVIVLVLCRSCYSILLAKKQLELFLTEVKSHVNTE